MAKTATSWVDFAACKQIPLIEIFQALGIPHDFAKHGESWRGVCPLPSHKHGSQPNARQFVITQKPHGQLWHCFGCQQGGDGVSMVRLVANVVNNGAREWYLQHFRERVTASGPADEVSTPEQAAEEEQEIVELKPLKFYLDVSAEAAAEYLQSRGIRWRRPSTLVSVSLRAASWPAVLLFRFIVTMPLMERIPSGTAADRSRVT